MKNYYIPIEKSPNFQALHKGIPYNTITAFFGPAFAGKSTFMAQLGCEVALARDGDLLVFDTENSLHTYVERREALEKMFDVTINIVRLKPRIEHDGKKTKRVFSVDWSMHPEDEVDKEALNLYVMHCPDIDDILVAHGRGMDIKISDKADSGKMQAVPQVNAWTKTADAPFVRFIQEAGIKCVIYDSLTNPLNTFVATSANFPGRADMSQAWMNQLHNLAALLDMPILVSMHESRNDSDPISKQLKPQGGKTVLYGTKYVTYMMVKNARGLLPSSATKPRQLADGERAMLLFRHSAKKPWADVAYFELTDDGLVDMEE